MNRRGEAAEALAADFLRARGLTITERNYHCRFGEIDLVAHDGTTVVFVEVRQRGTEDFGGARESITAAKRRRIITAARHYLVRRRGAPPCRFDAVFIRGEPPQIEWIRNAFGE